MTNKRYKDEFIQLSSSWCFFEGEDEGEPMLIRLNTGVKKLMGNPLYPFRIGIAIPLTDPNDLGFPNKEENEKLLEIEDSMCNLFERNMKAFLSIVIICGDAKEFVFYSTTDKEVEEKLQSLDKQYPEYEFQCYIDEDKDWTVYKELGGERDSEEG